MAFKLSIVVGAFCLLCYLTESEANFIKGKNVPRVGRSNEAEGPFDHNMGYVIKTLPSKNIPRMGRRNYDSENRYDIPKFYQLPLDNPEMLDADQSRFQERMEAYYGDEMENMKK